MSSLHPKPAPEGVETVDTFGDVAIERWQRRGHQTRGRYPHQPSRCPCFSCADGRALLDMQPFKPSPRAHFEGVRTC